nr:RNA-directed DNA polymerase, eukaryota, reverse transcriptase zinc-binding domain protein [Tanacetum cinerariifolium]
MKEKVEGCILADMTDRWFWALEGSGEFTITSVKKMIDDFMLPEVSSKMRWIKAVPIKCKLLAVGSPFFWQWEHPPLAVGTYTASGNSPGSRNALCILFPTDIRLTICMAV